MRNAPPMPFQFYIFGLPRLHVSGQPVNLPPQPAALCAFLVLHRQRRVTREEVQAAFWPEASPARAQERLRRTLYLLRRAIAPHTDLIVAEGAELAIAPDAGLWVDYEAFEQALLEAYRQDPPRREALERAVVLYADDLLKDTYADWALLEREHARQRFLTALRHLLSLCQQDEDWNTAIHYAHTLLKFDPFQEVAHRALMRAYAATGDRSAALRQYQQCVDILRRELDATPLPETTELYNAIRQGQGVAVRESLVLPAAPSPAPDLQFVPLVGREHELATIATEWNICRGGHSRLLLITGAAGMGKTRLVEEAVRRISDADVHVLIGHCYAIEAGTPYQLIADLMRGAVEQVWEELSPTVRADLAQIAPVLAATGNAASDPVPQTLTAPPDLSVRVQEAVAQVTLALLKNSKGLWLIAEDLHWADPASLAVLNYILRRCADLPLMVLATLRDEEVSFDSPLMNWPIASVSAPAPTTLLQLSPLRPAQLERLVKQLVTGDAAALHRLLYQETAGNPFFVVETLRALVEQGVLYPAQGKGWQLRADALPRRSDLPVSDVVLRVIRGRIRRLSRAAQEVLLLAAVIEHDIDEKLLQDLLAPNVALDLALDEVLRAHILEESADGIYQFSHIKVREIIYADTSAPRRRMLHRRVAEALSRAGAKPLAHVARLAYHYAQAREWTLAVLHGWQAAQTAFATGALAEANRYAEVTQAILDDHAEELNPARLPETLAAIRFDLLRLHAEFRRYAATAGLYYPTHLLDAIEALLPQVDTSRQAQASLLRATHLLGQGQLPAARQAAERGRALYAQIGDQRGELDAIQHQFDIAYRAGDMVTARRLVADLRTLSAAGGSLAQQTLAYNEMRLAVYEANWEAVLRLARTLSEQHDHTDPALTWPSLTNLGLAYMKLGAYEDALEVARRAVAASEEAHVLGLGARVLLAQLELWRGHSAEACRMLLSVLENPDPLLGEGEFVAPALVLVRCLIAECDTVAARQWAQRASRAVSAVRLPILYPLAQVGWALLHLAEERYEDATKDLGYPLEYLLLLADTSPQEIFALRASAARGQKDAEAARHWLQQAEEALRTQQARIRENGYRRSFVERVPLHRWIRRAQRTQGWSPHEILRLFP